MIPGVHEEFLPGSVLAGFTVAARAGAGASGTVLIVKDVSGRTFAMKILRDSGGNSAGELEALGKLRSLCGKTDGLASVHAAGKLDDGSGRFYYLMDAADNLAAPPEYLPDTLANRLARTGRMDAKTVLDLTKSLLTGLSSLHRAGLAHRDVKPENIIYRQNVPLLADFGLLSRPDGEDSAAGTSGFFPPEELTAPLNGSSSPKNDFYALGKVMYCAWTGREVSEYPAFHPSPDPGETRLIRGIYSRACSEKPAKRFSSAEEFLAAVEKARSGKRSGSKKRRLLAAAVLLTAVSVFAVFFFRGRPEDAGEAILEQRGAFALANLFRTETPLAEIETMLRFAPPDTPCRAKLEQYRRRLEPLVRLGKLEMRSRRNPEERESLRREIRELETLEPFPSEIPAPDGDSELKILKNSLWTPGIVLSPEEIRKFEWILRPSSAEAADGHPGILESRLNRLMEESRGEPERLKELQNRLDVLRKTCAVAFKAREQALSAAGADSLAKYVSALERLKPLLNDPGFDTPPPFTALHPGNPDKR